jgi:hypothetical protein
MRKSEGAVEKLTFDKADVTPFRVEVLDGPSQGGSFLATLGWVMAILSGW